MTRALGSVEALCVALAHGWELEHKFLILTAYLDESGTHDSQFSVMAGHVADARQWRKYEERTRKLFLEYGVEEFHAIDVRRGRNSFRNWTVDRKVEFLDDYHTIINETIELAVFSKIENSDYLWYRTLDKPNSKAVIGNYHLDVVGR